MYKEVNTGTNLPGRSIFMPLMATSTNSSVSPKWRFGKQDVSLSGNQSVTDAGKLKNYLVEKMRTLGTAACPRIILRSLLVELLQKRILKR